MTGSINGRAKRPRPAKTAPSAKYMANLAAKKVAVSRALRLWPQFSLPAKNGTKTGPQYMQQ